MPKSSGESMKTITTAPKPQPSRQILHGFGGASGKTAPNAMGAWKRFDSLTSRPASAKQSGGGSIDPRQMRF